MRRRGGPGGEDQIEREIELEARVRELERLRARLAAMEGDAEMATRMLQASGASQARLHQLLEEERLRNIELELRVARMVEEQPGNQTCEARGGDLGRTR